MKTSLSSFRSAGAVYVYTTLFVSVLMAVFMPEVVFEGDVHWWKVWATFIAEHGLAAAYTSPDLNYQPGLLYVLKIYEWLCDGKIETSIVLLKQLFFVFDVAAVMIAGFLLIRFQQSPYWSWLILLNPGFLYNTFLWGQCDSIYMLFCLLTILCLVLDKPYLAISFFSAALLSKPQAIFMGPLLLLIYWSWWKEQPIRWVKSVLVFAGSLCFVSLPFILHGDGDKLISLTLGAVDRLPSISMHAYNIWYLLIPGKDLVWEPDNKIFLFLTLRNWGFIMFTLAMVFTLRPLYPLLKKSTIGHGGYTQQMTSHLFLAFALVNMVFFFFNTQMHERYIHTAILFVGIYAILEKDLIPFIVLSIAYFLNLDHLMHHVRFPDAVYHAILPYNPLFIALLYLFVMVWSWKVLYRHQWTITETP
jgi:Gpi18-like mannosyltransferase